MRYCNWCNGELIAKREQTEIFEGVLGEDSDSPEGPGIKVEFDMDSCSYDETIYLFCQKCKSRQFFDGHSLEFNEITDTVVIYPTKFGILKPLERDIQETTFQVSPFRENLPEILLKEEAHE